MAIVHLAVRSALSGACRTRPVAAEASIEDWRVSLEAELPAFHAVKLLVGGHELCTGTVADAELSDGSEVQLLVVRAPEKALDDLDRMLTQGLKDYDIDAEDILTLTKDMQPALSFLGEEGQLEFHHCQRLAALFDGARSLFSHGDMLKLGRAAGQTFGRGCADPVPVIAFLLARSEESPLCSHAFEGSALAEIGSRNTDALREHASRLPPVARNLLAELIGLWDPSREPDADDRAHVRQACRFISRFGALVAEDLEELDWWAENANLFVGEEVHGEVRAAVGAARRRVLGAPEGTEAAGAGGAEAPAPPEVGQLGCGGSCKEKSLGADAPLGLAAW